jgi:hypothetical protein
VRDHLGVGVALEVAPLGFQLGLQHREVLDDAVVHQRHPAGRLRMGVAFGRNAVGGPARVADPHRGGQRLLGEQRLQAAQLALGPAPLDMAAHEPGHTRRVVAAVLQPLQALDQPCGDGRNAHDADDAAHGWIGPLWRRCDAISWPQVQAAGFSIPRTPA